LLSTVSSLNHKRADGPFGHRQNPTKRGIENNAMNRFVTTFAASHNMLRMSTILKVACPHSSRWFIMKKTALPHSEF
jgi:hypothetical protein